VSFADELDIARGDLISDASRPPRGARALEATLVWLNESSLDPRNRYLLKHTTRTVRAKVASIHHVVDLSALASSLRERKVALNDIARVSVVLQQPIFVDPYRENRATGAFVLIDESNQQTVAAGMIE